jgi:hypothetical protein
LNEKMRLNGRYRQEWAWKCTGTSVILHILDFSSESLNDDCPAGLLTCFTPDAFPFPLETVARKSEALDEAHSSGDCSGFAPDSLLRFWVQNHQSIAKIGYGYKSAGRTY